MVYTGTENKPSLKVALTRRCNLKCQYCGGMATGEQIGTFGAMEDFRGEPFCTGSIGTDTLLQLLQAFRGQGFRNIRPTGGEPTLHPEWYRIVDRAAEMGYEGVDITTNGTTLHHQLKGHEGRLPSGLSTVKVSLDTSEPEEYRRLTGGGDLKTVMRGIERIADQVWVRANTVLLRENAKPDKIQAFVKFSQELGVKQIQYLDLVHNPGVPGSDRRFWERQFVAWPEFKRIFDQACPGAEFVDTDDQFGVRFHRATLRNGMIVSFKDSRETMRDDECDRCSLYCQEGRCLVRIGTDGNVTFCPDYRAEMWHFNGPEAIANQTFSRRVAIIDKVVKSSRRMRTIEIFAARHGLKLPEEI